MCNFKDPDRDAPMPRIVAILDTMWGWKSLALKGYQAPRYFTINRANYSGKRLYKLVGDDVELFVTNSCSQVVGSAREYGQPDPDWLNENLAVLDQSNSGIDVLLVCGKVANATYAKSGYQPRRAIIFEMPHPAARSYWTRQVIDDTAIKIQGLIQEQQL